MFFQKKKEVGSALVLSVARLVTQVFEVASGAPVSVKHLTVTTCGIEERHAGREHRYVSFKGWLVGSQIRGTTREFQTNQPILVAKDDAGLWKPVYESTIDLLETLSEPYVHYHFEVIRRYEQLHSDHCAIEIEEDPPCILITASALRDDRYAMAEVPMGRTYGDRVLLSRQEYLERFTPNF